MRFTVEDMIDFAAFVVMSITSSGHTRKSLGKVLQVFCEARDIELTPEETKSILNP